MQNPNDVDVKFSGTVRALGIVLFIIVVVIFFAGFWTGRATG